MRERPKWQINREEKKMPKPKNCPKCNQPPSLMQTVDGVCGNTPMFYVECLACGCRTYAHLTKEKAIEAWSAEKEIINTGGVLK
jgi:transcription elongation factor Elf1